ncbi:hypothetical protein QR685DRAFT_514126 [Neurospora intermedia]|uniref:Uncharacterized protein n=1 Tax=Neurospora intermedia TaxID=5142 RepID=A0ABR3DTH5_NEUIN
MSDSSVIVPVIGACLFFFFALPILAFNAKRLGSAVIPITGGILLGLLIFFVFPFLENLWLVFPMVGTIGFLFFLLPCLHGVWSEETAGESKA